MCYSRCVIPDVLFQMCYSRCVIPDVLAGHVFKPSSEIFNAIKKYSK
jgi:hypothetical protein